MPSTKTPRSYSKTKDSTGAVTLIRNGSKYEKEAQKRANKLTGVSRKSAVKGARAVADISAQLDARNQGNYKRKKK